MPDLAGGTEALLSEIRDGVRLIVAALAEPLRKRLNEEFLTSAQRKKMYREFDGKQAYDVIAGKVGVTSEGVRQLAVALEAVGFVTLEKVDTKTCPRKLL
jgi:hypothetical protein